MIKIRVKRNISEDMLQEAMRVEEMGLPPLIVTFIKEDVPKSREAQVRLATILKDSLRFPKSILLKFAKTFDRWQEKLFPIWKATDSSDTDGVDFDSLNDRTTKLFKFLYEDVTKALNHDQNETSGRKIHDDKDSVPLTLKSIKGMRKALTKNLTKFGWPPEAGKKMSLFVDEMLIEYYNNYIRDYYLGNHLIAFLNEHSDNHKDLADMKWEKAVKFAENYFLEKEDEDMIVKTYPKKNLFWYNLGTTSCSIEAGRMGHCGADDRGALFSLRSKSSGQKASDSHVTISYNAGQNAIYQIKGKQNCVPDEKYGPYIVDFLEMYEVEYVHESGEHSNCDFTEFIEYLGEQYPEADYVQTELRALEEIDSEIHNGDHNTENVQIYSHLEDYGEEPYVIISGHVSFRISLDFLQTDEQKHKIAELFNEDHDENLEEIIDICEFDFYDEEGESFFFGFYPEAGYMQCSFDIGDRDDGGYCTTRNQVENAVGNLQYSYERSDCDNYGEKIIEYLTQKFGTLTNPETAAKMKEIKERIDELDEGYNHFFVWDDEDELYFQTNRIHLPIKVPYYPLPHGISASSNMEKYRSYRNSASDYVDILTGHSMREDIQGAFVDAIKMRSMKAYNAATKQVSLTAAGMELPPKPKDDPTELVFMSDWDIPKFVEIEIEPPSMKAISGDQKVAGRNPEVVPPVFGIRFTLKVDISDDITDVLWGMEYVDYLDKNMNDIMKIYEESKSGQSIQRTIHKIHREYMEILSDILKEGKRRLKIRVNQRSK